MNRQLPEDANLEHLKGQAKTLLHSLRREDPEALRSIAGLPLKEPFKLAGAQLAIARQYGFESWAKLKRHVEGYSERREGFFAAIRAGDRASVRRILEADRAIGNSRSPNDFWAAPITLAGNRNDIPMIDLLLEHGVDIDGRSIWWAGSFGALDFANDATSAHLLKRGATLTPHAAARLGMADELRRMIARDPAVVHERGGDGQYPLHFARTPEIVDILVDADADIDARDIDHEGTPLQNRILIEPVARRLVERGATQDLFSAVALGDIEILEKLLDADPEGIARRTDEPGNPWIPQAPGWHIYTYNLGFVRLHQAATNLGQDAAYAFLWEKSSPELRLAMAIWRGDRDKTLEVAVAHPEMAAHFAQAERHMLTYAAGERRVETVKLLLEIGVDRDVVSIDGWRAVNRAAFFGFDDIIAAILPYQPDLSLPNPFGGTPLRCCVYGSVHCLRKDGDYPRSVELLIEAGSELPDQVYGSEAVQAVLKRHGVV